MLKKLLVLILVCSSANVIAKTSSMARPKMNKSVGVKAPLRFELNYYYQLNYANRKKYINTLMDLAVKIENDQRGRKTASHVFDIEALLMPHAEAANKICVFGGIAMSMAVTRCPNTLDSIPADYVNTEFFSCPAGQNRCSLAAGISSSGKGYCYANTVSAATVACEASAKADTAAGMGGVERLTQALDRCQKSRASSTLNCESLSRALTKDTENISAVCASSNRPYCNIAKSQVASLSPYVAGGTTTPTPPAGGKDGCAEAEQAIIGDGLSGTNISPMWMKLITMTRQVCSSASGLAMDEQLKRFGACSELTAPRGTSSDVESAVSSNYNLGAGIGKMMSGGTNTMNPEERKAFQEYFGITPFEYNKLFCESNSTNDFYEKLGSVADDSSRPASQNMTPAALFSWFSNNENLPAMMSSVPNTQATGKFRDALKSYSTLAAESRAQGSVYESTTAACNGGAVPLECAKLPALDMNAINAKKREALNALKAEFSTALANSGNRIEAVIGAANFEAIQKEINDKSAGLSSAAYAQRSKFKACTASAVSARPAATGSRLASQEAVSSVGSTCHQSKVDKIDGRNSGKLYIMDSATNKCFVSDGTPTRDSSCEKGRTAIKTNFGSSSAPSPNICLEDAFLPANYTAFSYTCNRAPLDMPSADAMVK